MKTYNHSIIDAAPSSLRALGLSLLWIFAITAPVLAQVDKAERLLAEESLGGIKLNLAEKKLVDLLGQPKTKGKVQYQEAIGEYFQTWSYPDKGLEIAMSSGANKNGARKVALFTASSGCSLATAKSVKVGSPESDVRKAYASYEDKEDSKTEKNSFVAGSIYGGIIFTFKDKKVSSIFFGAAAE